MIIARIDNELTARTPHRRGRSFKGALAYLLQGSKENPHPERVLHAETVNIFGDLSDAAHTMACTWEARFRLMQGAGLSNRNGANNTAPVYHLVMSWSQDEDVPPPADMAELAKQLLHLLGLGEHEAVLVVHGDTQNPHIHILVNTVHPITGRTAPLAFDKRIMQGFAARYEELQGKVVCKGRFAPSARTAFNSAARDTKAGRRSSRPRWARENAPAAKAKRAVLPSVILDALTLHHATFTAPQLARAITAATTSAKEFASLMGAIMKHPDLVTLQDDGHASKKYTTRTQLEAEKRLASNAASLAGSIRHGVNTSAQVAAWDKFAAPAQKETREALTHLLDERGLSLVVGYAGAGKSTLLRTAAEAWHASGFKLRGLALAGRAAEGLEADANIPSGTIAAFLMGLESGTVKLACRDIVVVDEAGMVASRQLDRVLGAVKEAGAKIVLVGDPEQLQAIEAGGPFRYLLDHYDHARLTTIWRQKQDWMRAATRALAEGATAIALEAYERGGMLRAYATSDDAIASILDMWLASRDRGASQLILTATNAYARRVNEAARARLMAMNVLGAEYTIETDDGALPIAVHDRVMFRRNDRKMGVKNGTTGTVVELSGNTIVVEVDGAPPRVVRVNTVEYPHIAHGYAVTIHKSQGATVDRTYVLAAPNMDRHSAYVALSRHRERVSLHWARDAFKDRGALARALSRKRVKDVTLDYREIITDGVREVMAQARKATATMPEIDAWQRLYSTQREEAAKVNAMSAVRRAFWMAANIDRFLKAGVVSLAKLHERERAAFSATLRAARTTASATRAHTDPTRPKPAPEAILGISRPSRMPETTPRI